MAAPVAASDPPVDVLLGDSSPPFVPAGDNVVIPVGPFVAEAPVPFNAPSVGRALPLTGTGTCGVGKVPPTTVCRPV